MPHSYTGPEEEHDSSRHDRGIDAHRHHTSRAASIHSKRRSGRGGATRGSSSSREDLERENARLRTRLEKLSELASGEKLAF